MIRGMLTLYHKQLNDNMNDKLAKNDEKHNKKN